MQPDLETFRKAVEQYRGNLSKVATAFQVTRGTIANWLNAGGDEWKQVVRDARMRLFDDCLISAEILARGIPEKDEEGNIIGWIEKPDGQMVRYVLSSLGKNEPIESQQREIRVQVVYNSAADLELQERGANNETENKEQ